MLTSLGLILLVGLALGAICKKIKLPSIVGMLVTGILLGPFVLDLLDPSILNISADLRKMALIIILIKAGLSLDLADLKKVGRPAILLSFLPATFEIMAYVIFAPKIFGISTIDAALMGSVLAAVSPAVVVPRMVYMIENKIGTKKGIPQMIMAGASCDDIFVIVLFTSFLSMAQGGVLSPIEFLNVPISIILGIILGAMIGYILYYFFENAFNNNRMIRNSTKLIIILTISFMIMALEEKLASVVALSGLLAIVSMASVLRVKMTDSVSARLSEKFGKLWIGAEVLLFVLVGAAVDIRYTLSAGFAAVLMIFIALAIRSIGVLISLIKTPLKRKEKVFTVVAYLPKATVQAAIGSVPLAAGLSSGNIILSVAVMGILITAPLGAIGIDRLQKKLP
ncbi:cation:proton antiporter [uncultured Ezakiella sp.]|uniref:cation:proton antiporter n=1 Tax=uncultured Ezakiella sp. TaxID=1637529 RepID=UPI0025F462EE|nr:cation:proton antiporter [uncultured Ezakiella sp.]